MSNKYPKGITIFGILLIVSSTMHMHTLLDFEHYRYLFHPLPEGIILLRYSISWGMRIIGLISAVGILRLKDIFRKISIYLFIFTILTVNWKHPCFGFQNHAAYLDKFLKDSGLYPLEIWGTRIPSFSSLANVSALCAQILEVLFAAVFIYYFTRPKIKVRFKTTTMPLENYGLLENLLAKKRARMADRLIPDNLRNGRILDIGCGTTVFFLLNAEFKYKYGIDSAVNTRLYKEGVTLQKFDLEKNARLPFEDGFFDAVTMLAVLEHIKPDKLPGVLKEIKRILKPNGRLIITTPCFWTENLLKLMAKLKLINLQKLREHKKTYGKTAILQYLGEAGFEKKKMISGYFELFMNSWFYADNNKL